MMKTIAALIVVMFFGFVAYSQNYWNKVNSGIKKNLLSVSFGSKTAGYIGGADSTLLKTTDGGHTWNNINHTGMYFSLAARDIVHVNFLNADTGFAIVSNFSNPLYSGSLYQTMNGGATWTAVNAGNIAACNTFFHDVANGYVVGSAFFAGKTLIQLSNGIWGNDRQFAWQPDNFLYTIDCRNNICITAGDSGYVYRTFNNGTTWDTVKTVTDSTIYSLKFINDSVLVGAVNHPMEGVIISTDTGKTWQVENNLLTFFYPQMRSVAVSKKDSFIVVGKVNWDTTGVILWWNGGVPMNTGAEQALFSIAMRDDSIAFAVGNNGLIMSNKQASVGISYVETKTQLHIYPNPTKGKIKTAMTIAHTVKVYDLTGRIIYENNDNKLEHFIDLSANAKGVYLLEASSEQKHVCEKILLQ